MKNINARSLRKCTETVHCTGVLVCFKVFMVRLVRPMNFTMLGIPEVMYGLTSLHAAGPGEIGHSGFCIVEHSYDSCISIWASKVLLWLNDGFYKWMF